MNGAGVAASYPEGSHLEFAQAESAALESDREWLRWLDAVKSATGLSNLDGDEAEDGYSLDGASDAFDAGMPADVYALNVRSAIAKHPRGAA